MGITMLSLSQTTKKKHTHTEKQVKVFADDNTKFDENGGNFSEWLENAAGNFSFFHSVFKRPVLQTRENKGLFGNGLCIMLCKP